MTGNAIEEALLTRLDYPGHADAGRMAGLAGGASGLLVGFGVGLSGGWIPGVLFGALAWGVVGMGTFTARKRQEIARRAAQAEEQRRGAQQEQKRQIDAVRAGRAAREEAK